VQQGGSVKRVYLDQNKWIDLTRAKHGQKSGERFADALTVARAGVEHGLISFPLSLTHYMEVTQKPSVAREPSALTSPIDTAGVSRTASVQPYTQAS
jgi:hypothetical protein